jgi:hypothetical protein
MTPTILDLSQGKLESAFRRWGATSNRSSRAAVELLIDHGTWTKRRDFIERAMQYYPDEDLVAIRWATARTVYDNGLRGGTGELAVLDFAIMLGQDKFAWNTMGNGHRKMFEAAVHRAFTA